MGAIDKLKKIIREGDDPFFSDEELLFYLEENENDVRATAYECLLLKSENDSIGLPGGLEIPNNENYWLRLANKYKPNKSRVM